MATLHYKLKSPSSKSSTLIYAVFCHKGLTVKVSTGLKIHPDDWNQARQCMRSIRRNVDVDNFNTDLSNMATAVLDKFRGMIAKGEPISQHDIKNLLKTVMNPSIVVKQSPKTFVEGAKEYIRTCNKKEWTRKHYLTALNIIERYQTSRKITLQYEDIDMVFYNDFTQWMQDKKQNKVQSYALNTIGSVIKEIKVFMNAAIDNGWTNAIGHLHRKFVTVEEDSDTIYLSVEKINKIYTRNFPTRKALERVKDLFVIGCWTGLRYADLSQITPECFVRNGSMLKIKTQKTGEIVFIPLHRHVKEIVEKYNGFVPKAYANQPMNRWLKVVARLAGLTDRVTKTITRGGMQVTTAYFEWQLVTVHTSRRSFATNAYLSGIPSLSISKITGHRTEKSLLKYIKISSEQNAELIQSNQLFAS